MSVRTPLVYNRLYGPVPQGEGPTAGQPRVFLRLSRCDLRCVWCDVPETWNWNDYLPRDHQIKEPAPAIAERIMEMSGDGKRAGLVITGGEPMLQQNKLIEVMHGLSAFVYTEVESNGRHAPGIYMEQRIDQWNLSPKLANSGNPEALRRPHTYWSDYRVGNLIGKFVVEAPGELDEVAGIVDKMRLQSRQVWIMPQAVDAATLAVRTRTLEGPVMERGWNLSGRAQIIAWGSEPGH